MSDDWPRQFASRIADGDDRWALIEEFVERWYQGELELVGNTDAEIDEAEERIGVQFPESLRRWYRLAGKSLGIVNGQDTFFGLSDLKPLEHWDNHLVVRMECQNGCQWGFTMDEVHLADPPVHIFDGDVDTGYEEANMADFALFNVLYEALHSMNFGAYGYSNEATQAALDAKYVDVGWRPRYWLEYTRIYLGHDALFVYMPQCDNIYVSCRTDAVKQEVIATIPTEWHDD